MSKEALAKAQAVQEHYRKKEKTVAELGKLFNLSRATIYRYLQLTPQAN